jgi:hypothetical protein
MNQTKQLYLGTLIISIAFFLLGQMVFLRFFDSLEPQFDLITLQAIELRNGIPSSFLFSLTLFLIPILTFATWRLAPIISRNKKIASGLIILIFITLGIWMRHQEVKAFYTYLLKNHLILIGNKPVIQSVDPVRFVYHMFAGLCVGCIVSFLLLRQISSSGPDKS